MKLIAIDTLNVQIIKNAIDSCLKDGVPPQTALELAQQEIDKLIK